MVPIPETNNEQVKETDPFKKEKNKKFTKPLVLELDEENLEFILGEFPNSLIYFTFRFFLF